MTGPSDVEYKGIQQKNSHKRDNDSMDYHRHYEDTLNSRYQISMISALSELAWK